MQNIFKKNIIMQLHTFASVAADGKDTDTATYKFTHTLCRKSYGLFSNRFTSETRLFLV